ncbi:hypothetical protein PanWU01x14_110310, partial [Parasponia andersonii]
FGRIFGRLIELQAIWQARAYHVGVGTCESAKTTAAHGVISIQAVSNSVFRVTLILDFQPIQLSPPQLMNFDYAFSQLCARFMPCSLLSAASDHVPWFGKCRENGNCGSLTHHMANQIAPIKMWRLAKHSKLSYN